MPRASDPAVGLCARCRHARVVKTPGASYWLCERSRTDPRYPKYPRLPVIRCAGFEPEEAEPAPGTETG